ncbi:serine hydrolase domain-containing protein [Gymnodinialimonas hymeniacidonis]|uniref:serine hydrolase domain-containing protein n=1 Tax=Gymnodinialimonas hymeniacidonis TaxID=3126508 RepID=UPI0034C69DF0
MIHLAMTLAALLVWSTSVAAQTAPQDVADALAAYDAVPAATAGRVTADDLAAAVAGTRLVDGSDMAALSDVWHVGSLTKSMTATLAARLVADGLIQWDSTIGEVLGEAFPQMQADWQDVTLTHLLTHGSGMEANLGRIRSILLGDGPRADYVREMLSNQPLEAPGGFAYSNAGYVVAGAMLEAVGEDSWEALIEREVFAPLSMDSAGFGAPQGNVIEGHSRGLFGGLTPAGQGNGADNIPAMGPAGRVHLSAEDMLRYLRAHLLRDTGFLPDALWEDLHRAVGPEGYAMGWGVGEDGSLVHSGSNTLWYAVAYVDPAGGEAVFVAVNSGDLDQVAGPVDEALRALLSHPPD